MAQYHVDVTEQASVQVDLPPGLPMLLDLALTWGVSTERELVDAAAALGFELADLDPRRDRQYRFGLPLTRDGEQVGRAMVQLILAGELIEEPEPAPMPRLAAIVHEARRERRDAAPTVDHLA